MTRFASAALAVAAGLFVAGAALAAAAPTFESLDSNGDGKISINEATVNDELFVAFQKLDKDKNGELSKEEFAAYKK
jgi:Ca2+-binding EF-hand superfamily protein